MLRKKKITNNFPNPEPTIVNLQSFSEHLPFLRVKRREWVPELRVSKEALGEEGHPPRDQEICYRDAARQGEKGGGTK